jgi:hypothetical protein
MQGKITASDAMKLFNRHASSSNVFEAIAKFESEKAIPGTFLYFGSLPLSQFFLTSFAESGPLIIPPENKKNYSLAELDSAGRPITFLCFDDSRKARNGGIIHYFGESSWISIDADLEQKTITGGTIYSAQALSNEPRGFRIYKNENSIDEYIYEFSGHNCARITMTGFQGDHLTSFDHSEYTFFYDNSNAISKVIQNGKRIVYQAPKISSKESSLNHAASLNHVNDKLSKEIATFTTKSFPLKNTTGIGIFYDVSSKFSNLSIGVTSQSLVGVSKLTDEEIINSFDLQEEEFFELEDFENSSSALKKHLQFLESNWKTTDAEFSEEMNRFCDHVLEMVKKKHPNVAYVFWCDRECTNLAKNIRKLASEN